MPWTRRQLITAALEEIGIGSDFDIAPEMFESARVRLDSMMAEWNGRGLRLAYPLENSPTTGDLDDVTPVPDSATQAIITNLAIILAPGYGRTPSPDTKATAKRSLSTIENRSAQPIPMQFPSTLPVGAGNRWRRQGRAFYPRPRDPVLAGPDGPITFD